MTRKMLTLVLLALFLLIGSNVQASEKQKRIKEVKLSSKDRIEKPAVKIEKRGDRNYVVGTILIDAKPESIWDVLVDYRHAPQVFKNLKLCEVVGQRGQIKLVRQIANTGSPIKFDYIVALVEKNRTASNGQEIPAHLKK